MTVVCAWCKKIMYKGTNEITHGICKDCLAIELKKIG